MNRRNKILAAVFLCSSVGVGSNSLFAQALPGPTVPKRYPRSRNKHNQPYPGNPRQGSHQRNRSQDSVELYRNGWRRRMPAVSARW